MPVEVCGQAVLPDEQDRASSRIDDECGGGIARVVRLAADRVPSAVLLLQLVSAPDGGCAARRSASRSEGRGRCGLGPTDGRESEDISVTASMPMARASARARRGPRARRAAAVARQGAVAARRQDTAGADLGAVGSADRLNWLVSKKRCRNSRSQWQISPGRTRGGPRRRSCRATACPDPPTRGARGTRPSTVDTRIAARGTGESPGVRKGRRSPHCAACGRSPVVRRDELGGDLRVEDRHEHVVGHRRPTVPCRPPSAPGTGSGSWAPMRSRRSATSGRRRRRCTIRAPARRDHRCRPPAPGDDWRAGTVRVRSPACTFS